MRAANRGKARPEIRDAEFLLTGCLVKRLWKINVWPGTDVEPSLLTTTLSVMVLLAFLPPARLNISDDG